MNIPNYVDMKVIGEDGHFTPEWKIIMQQLLTTLNRNAGPEGLVAPTQTDANITLIQNNQIQSSIAPDMPTFIYTCQFGTLIYDSDTNELKLCLSNAGVPQFYTVVTI